MSMKTGEFEIVHKYALFMYITKFITTVFDQNRGNDLTVKSVAECPHKSGKIRALTFYPGNGGLGPKTSPARRLKRGASVHLQALYLDPFASWVAFVPGL